MVKLALRGIRASLGRLILTTIAIVAGVGFVAGAFILADSLQDTFDGIFASAASGTDARIQLDDLDFGTDVRTIPDTLIDEVASLPEVGEVTPDVQGNNEDNFRPFIVLDDEGNTIEPNGPPILAFSWNGEDIEDSITLASGEPPVGLDRVALDQAYADRAGLEPGDELRMSTPDGEKTFTLSGTVDFPATGGAYFVLFDFPSAQVLFDKQGQVDTITLTRAAGVSTEDMITAVQEILPEDATVIDQATVIEEDSEVFEQIIGIFRNALLAFAGIALFVSLFIIYNTFAILVNQRLQQIGMLRAVGATRGQIRLSLVLEALVVGIIGSAIGIGFGLVVAFGIKTAFQAGGGFPDTGTVLAPRTIVVSLLVGIVATLISALLPAILAGRISPVAAMRNEAPTRSSLTRRTVIGAVILALGLVLLGLGLFGGGDSVSGVLTLLGMGAVLLFIGVALLSVLFAGPIVNLLGRAPVLGTALLGLGVLLPILTFTTGDGLPDGFFSWITFPIKMLVSAVAVITGASILAGLARGRPVGLGGSGAGLEGRLARQNAARAPQRTAATATALTIGIALVSTVGVVGESIKASFSQTLDRAIEADLFIYEAETGGGFPNELATEVEAVDGIASVSRFRANEARLGPDDIVSLAAFDGATGTEIIDFDVTEGSLEGLIGNGMLVFAEEAEDRSLAVGDVVPVEFPDNEVEDLTVVGLFNDNSVLNSPFVVDLATYERHVSNTSNLFVGAAVADGADLETVKAEVKDLATAYSGVTAEDTAEFQESQEGQIDQLITLINLLLALALFVAFLGVVNTIVLSVIERTREIGLLRAVGMTRDQIRSTIRWEAVIVCLFGALLGIVLGIVFAVAAMAAIPDDIIGATAIPYESILFAILVAALAGVLAAILPARRAAKLNVLDAISGRAGTSNRKVTVAEAAAAAGGF